VVARFDLPDTSSDGGLVLLKAVDSQLGLTAQLAAGLDDGRQAGKVLHEPRELVRQRVFGLCAGCADCNDAARLVHDPIHKLVLERDPVRGLGLASQPTLSRFENAVGWRELRAMSHTLAAVVIERQRRQRRGHARRVTIDLDPTAHRIALTPELPLAADLASPRGRGGRSPITARATAPTVSPPGGAVSPSALPIPPPNTSSRPGPHFLRCTASTVSPDPSLDLLGPILTLHRSSACTFMNEAG
jgi:hypothetical protein